MAMTAEFAQIYLHEAKYTEGFESDSRVEKISKEVIEGDKFL